MKTGRFVAGAVLGWLLGFPFLVFCQQTEPVAKANAVLATIEGYSITQSDIEERTKSDMLRLNNQIYAVKKRAVNALIDERLMEIEAGKHGLSLQELLEREVTDKAKAVTEEEIEAFYKANKTRLGNKPLDELRDRIARQLQGAAQRGRRQAFVQELRKAAAITMNLKPPIVEVAIDGAPTLGPAEAPVTVVEFGDYECPYCARVQPTLHKIRETYKGQVKFVFKDFPLSIHPQAQKAAEAARCAGQQDKYWDYHDVLFRNTKALQVDKLKQYAADLQLDTTRFDTCLDSGQQADAVRRDLAQGSQLGVSGTPTFFINGRFFSGARQLSAFQTVIDEVLAAD